MAIWLHPIEDLQLNCSCFATWARHTHTVEFISQPTCQTNTANTSKYSWTHTLHSNYFTTQIQTNTGWLTHCIGFSIDDCTNSLLLSFVAQCTTVRRRSCLRPNQLKQLLFFCTLSLSHSLNSIAQTAELHKPCTILKSDCTVAQ